MDKKHTMEELNQYQSLPLSVKIRMTEYRIREWIRAYGEDGVYVSFSGGKDSTVLLDIVHNRCGYKNVPAVFVDVPTQYPELKSFAIDFCKKNGIELEILKPKMSFAEVCKKYGFPIISKEVSESVYGAKRYLKQILDELREKSTIVTDRQTDRQTDSTSIGISTKKSQEQEDTVNFQIPSLRLMVLQSQEIVGGVRQKVSKNQRNWRIC